MNWLGRRFYHAAEGATVRTEALAECSGSPRSSAARRRWRAVLRLVGALLLIACCADAARTPGAQWTAAGAIGAIHLYQRALSPTLAHLGARCRFTPGCSHYAEGALLKHGIVRGGWLAIRRVARCGPWTPAGTSDPVP